MRSFSDFDEEHRDDSYTFINYEFVYDISLRQRLFDHLYWELYAAETIQQRFSATSHDLRWRIAKDKFWTFYGMQTLFYKFHRES